MCKEHVITRLYAAIQDAVVYDGLGAVAAGGELKPIVLLKVRFLGDGAKPRIFQTATLTLNIKVHFVSCY